MIKGSTWETINMYRTFLLFIWMAASPTKMKLSGISLLPGKHTLVYGLGLWLDSDCVSVWHNSNTLMKVNWSGTGHCIHFWMNNWRDIRYNSIRAVVLRFSVFCMSVMNSTFCVWYFTFDCILFWHRIFSAHFHGGSVAVNSVVICFFWRLHSSQWEPWNVHLYRGRMQKPFGIHFSENGVSLSLTALKMRTRISI